MKFSSKYILPTKRCMRTKCKSCTVKETCDLIDKLEDTYEPLTYKPFANLKEIMDAKNK